MYSMWDCLHVCVIWWSWGIVCGSYKELMLISKEKKNGRRRHGHQVWLVQKLWTTVDLQVMKMILSECEDCGDNTVGGDHFQSRHEMHKMAFHNKMADFLLEWHYWSKRVWSWGICIPNFVLLHTCGRWGWTIGGATEPTGHDHAKGQ